MKDTLRAEDEAAPEAGGGELVVPDAVRLAASDDRPTAVARSFRSVFGICAVSVGCMVLLAAVIDPTASLQSSLPAVLMTSAVAALVLWRGRGLFAPHIEKRIAGNVHWVDQGYALGRERAGREDMILAGSLPQIAFGPSADTISAERVEPMEPVEQNWIVPPECRPEPVEALAAAPMPPEVDALARRLRRIAEAPAALRLVSKICAANAAFLIILGDLAGPGDSGPVIAEMILAMCFVSVGSAVTARISCRLRGTVRNLEKLAQSGHPDAVWILLQARDFRRLNPGLDALAARLLWKDTWTDADCTRDRREALIAEITTHRAENLKRSGSMLTSATLAALEHLGAWHHIWAVAQIRSFAITRNNHAVQAAAERCGSAITRNIEDRKAFVAARPSPPWLHTSAAAALTRSETEPAVAVDPRISRLLAQLRSAVRWRKGAMPLFALSIPGSVAVAVGIFISRGSVPLAELGLLATMTPFAIMAGVKPREQKVAAQLCAEPGPEVLWTVLSLTDIRACTPELDRNLPALLRRLNASHATGIIEEHRKLLRRELELLPGRTITDDKANVMCAVLEALAQVGNTEDVAAVSALEAATAGIPGKMESVNAAARACLPYLTQSAFNNKTSETLLRASQQTYTDEGLLRAASEAGSVQPEELLRAEVR